MNDELAVLRAGVDDVAAATGLDPAVVTAVVGELVASGGAREVAGAYMLLPPGRERQNELLDEERAGVDTDAIASLYEDFTAVNGDFKQLASDWQLRDGEPNDHTDTAYDQGVLDRLPSIHARVSPVAEASAAVVPRLAPYGARLSTALARVQAGDHAWLLKPLIDSYHTVWFEYHEELIGLAGLSREAEAASGRAE
jgi:pyruvate, orthophosphate dikinase